MSSLWRSLADALDQGGEDPGFPGIEVPFPDGQVYICMPVLGGPPGETPPGDEPPVIEPPVEEPEDPVEEPEDPVEEDPEDPIEGDEPEDPVDGQ